MIGFLNGIKVTNLRVNHSTKYLFVYTFAISHLTISQMTTNYAYERQLIPIFKVTLFWGWEKAHFFFFLLVHIKFCLHQQSLDGWDKFFQ